MQSKITIESGLYNGRALSSIRKKKRRKQGLPFSEFQYLFLAETTKSRFPRARPPYCSHSELNTMVALDTEHEQNSSEAGLRPVERGKVSQ